VAIFVSNTTTAVHLPGSFACVIVPGQCITGCSVSATETVNLHVSFGATPLEATQLTSVVPLENAVPDGGVQTIAGGGHPLIAVGGVNATTAEQWPESLSFEMLAGHGPSRGGSWTVIPAVCVPLSTFPETAVGVSPGHVAFVYLVVSIRLTIVPLTGFTLPFAPPLNVIANPFITMGFMEILLLFVAKLAVSLDVPPGLMSDGDAVNFKSIRGSASTSRGSTGMSSSTTFTGRRSSSAIA